MPYFWPSRGLQVRGLIKNLSGTYRTEYTFNQVRALEYEATSFEHAGPMRHDCNKEGPTKWEDPLLLKILLQERSTSRIQKEDGNFKVR